MLSIVRRTILVAPFDMGATAADLSIIASAQTRTVRTMSVSTDTLGDVTEPMEAIFVPEPPLDSIVVEQITSELGKRCFTRIY